MSHKKDTKNMIREQIREVGLKATDARVALMEVLGREHGPFSAEELHQKLSRPKSASRVDLVTVYRCLSKLEEVELVRRCDFGDGTTRYEASHTDHHHHHMICRVCKDVVTLDGCPIQEIYPNLPNLGFKDLSHRLEFFGVCPRCQ